MGTSVRCNPARTVRDAGAQLRYRRSRTARRTRLAAGAAAIAAAGIVLLGAAGGASSPPTRVTVHAGDTLWSIASAAYAGGDVEAHVVAIEAANHLAGPALKPGEVLLLPSP